MFESLSDRLHLVFKKLRGHGKLTDENIQDALREVRLALLDADVHFTVVKEFIAAIQERAVGREVLEALSPGQQVIKIVHETLLELLGGQAESLDLGGPSPAVIMMVGLQGSGKTTTAAKLAKFLKKKGRRPYLAPADIYRPAAIDQLTVLGGTVDVPVHPSTTSQLPEAICGNAVTVARNLQYDTVIIDTAGRLHIDEDLMNELRRIKAAVNPREILFVADAMTGQDAVNVAAKFHEDLAITGVILTKLEGDARAGAALSIKKVTDCAIKFVGVGEELDALEIFHPDRLASRILGMGDVLTLIEKAEAVVDQKQAEKLANKIHKDAFTLEDFLEQIQQIRKMGSLEQLIGMIPGFNRLQQMKNIPKPDEKELVRAQAIIQSMTSEERRKHNIINAGRRLRIARGSGTSVQDVNKVIKSYTEMLKMMKKMKGKGKIGGGLDPLKKKRKRPKGLFR